MTTLAFEFSTDHRSVAVVRDGAILSEICHEAGRATPVKGLTQRALEVAGVAASEVMRVAIGTGPGSYTGIRSALAWAQGWCLARELPAAGVSSVSAAVADLATPARLDGRGVWLVDALRGEFYAQRLDASHGAWRCEGALELVSAEWVRGWIQAQGTVFGAGLGASVEGAVEGFPRAGRVGLLAAAAEWFSDPGLIEPIYLRAVSFVKAPPLREDLMALAGPG